MPTYYQNRYGEVLLLANSHRTHLFYLKHDLIESYEKRKDIINEWFLMKIGRRRFYNLLRKHDIPPRQLSLFLPVQHTIHEQIEKEEKRQCKQQLKNKRKELI